jgi:uncharacterized protein YjiS (DUF1127 family)
LDPSKSGSIRPIYGHADQRAAASYEALHDETHNRIRQFPYFEFERQIRIERSLAISAFVRGVLCALAHWVRLLAVQGVRLARVLAAARSRRRAVFELQQFDDRTLADMGLKRGEIDFAVRNGLPRHLTQTAQMRPKQLSSEKAVAQPTGRYESC